MEDLELMVSMVSNSDVQLILTKPNKQPAKQTKTPKISINVIPEP